MLCKALEIVILLLLLSCTKESKKNIEGDVNNNNVRDDIEKMILSEVGNNALADYYGQYAIAVERLLKSCHLSFEDRQKIWNEYVEASHCIKAGLENDSLNIHIDLGSRIDDKTAISNEQTNCMEKSHEQFGGVVNFSQFEELECPKTIELGKD